MAATAALRPVSRGQIPARKEAVTDQGDSSGYVTRVVLNEEVSKERMAELLVAQGSDPEFLIGYGEGEES